MQCRIMGCILQQDINSKIRLNSVVYSTSVNFLVLTNVQWLYHTYRRNSEGYTGAHCTILAPFL